jgi:predicted metal-dependent HD superfamily phosphohydrolase
MNPQLANILIIDRLSNELHENLKYHSYIHTLKVYEAVKVISKAEGVKGDEKSLLLTAAAYHDCGFLRSYFDHEFHGCEIAKEMLPEFGYGKEDIKKVCEMIEATKVPQQPKDHLARILCDADLDYLGGDEYDEIADGLYREFLLNGIMIDEEKWLDTQIKFLETHEYWTDFSRINRNPRKLITLAKLKSRKEFEGE